LWGLLDLKHLFDAFQSTKMTLEKDKIQAEIKNRIENIDNGKEALTLYCNGMDEMLNRLKIKYTP